MNTGDEGRRRILGFPVGGDPDEPRVLGLPRGALPGLCPEQLHRARHPVAWVRWRIAVHRQGPYAPAFDAFVGRKSSRCRPGSSG